MIECGKGTEAIQQLTEKLHIDVGKMYQLITHLKQEEVVKLAANIFDKNIGDLNPAFVNEIKEKLNIVPEKAQSVEQINGWCAKNTNDRIKEIVSDLNFETLLISAIHFKANWTKQFDPKMTTSKDFAPFSGEKRKVEMMYKNEKLDFAETASAKLLRLSYDKSEFQAVIILPKADGAEAFFKALDSIGETNFANHTKVQVMLPKFKVESTLPLNEVVQKLGATQIFGKVDYSKTLGKAMNVDLILQKTFIEVNEEGTEAAAVTAIRMMRCAAMPEPTHQFICDHPYWFVLMFQGEPIFVTSYV